MKIAVNTRLLIKNKLDGIGWFSYETLNRITEQRPNDEFIFIFDREWDDSFIFNKNVTPVKIGPPSRHPFLWYLWFEQSIPKVLKRHQPDIFLSPDGYLSLNTETPSLPVIHDLNFEHYPKDLPFWYRQYYKNYFPKYAQKATRIATVSEFSKQDIVTKYGIEASKIDVVYNGISERFKPLTALEKDNSQVLYANSNPYFVFVGTLHPRKNIARLLSAFDTFKNSGRYAHNLVIIGRRKWWTTEMENTFHAMSYKDSVIFHEQVSQEQVAAAVGGSEALLYPSTFEGFGVPILEGMQAEVPVITSNVSSMPEIASAAALLCNPFESKSIAEQMKRLIHEPNLSESLIEKGALRAKDFSWNNTADLLWKSIEKVAHKI